MSGSVLQQELGCTAATVKRLVAKMRNVLNAPIRSDQRGYWYARDAGLPMFELPGLWFNDRELVALLAFQTLLAQSGPSLVEEALRPLRQRVQRLLTDRRLGLPDWTRRLRFLRIAARPAGPRFAAVADALVKRRQLRILYHARSTNEQSERDISPQRLVHYRDNWYLDAWCHRARGLRIFALDRIAQATLLEAPCLEVAEDELGRVLATSFGIFAGEPTATAILAFSAHAARWVADEVWHPNQRTEPIADGRLRLELPYHRAEELLREILRFEADVEVLGPPELRRAVAEAHAAAAERYAPDRSAGLR